MEHSGSVERVPDFAPRLSTLSTGDVHIWWSWLDAPDKTIDEVTRILSGDERERAARFVRALDRRRFVVARAMLRRILARYLDCPPSDITFTYEPRGKPRLICSELGSDLEFNLAHSENLVVYVLSKGRRTGIDVEHLRPLRDLSAIVRTTFSRAEQERLFALPHDQQLHSFFVGWTRKEAYLKGRGDGLLLPLDTFDVSFAPNEPAALLASRSHPEDVARWSIHDIAPVEGYVGAAAVESTHVRLLIQRWNPS